MVVADYSECPLQEVVADVKHGWCCTERCQKVLIPYVQQVSLSAVVSAWTRTSERAQSVDILICSLNF